MPRQDATKLQAPEGQRLVLFTRYPEPGKSKTRLIPALGKVGAAELQRRLTEHVLDAVRQLVRSETVTLELRYAGSDRHRMATWLSALGWTTPTDPAEATERIAADDATNATAEQAATLALRDQGTGDLGQRMRRAVVEANEDALRTTVIIGSDVPDLTAHHVQRAFEALQRCDLVLGPATDGGYYLIGLTRPQVELFTDIAWGSDQVLTHTLRTAEQLGLRIELLDQLKDIDRPDDLAALTAFPTLAHFARS